MLAASSFPAWAWIAIVVLVLWSIGKFNKTREVKSYKSLSASNGFATVAGCEEAIEDLREIVSFLADPAPFKRLGATIPKGALLVGPPGTGKTLLARAVAAEAGVPFIPANGSDFVEMFVGVGAKRIRELYQQARSHERAIVFIDELDAVARKRAYGAGNDTGSGGVVEHENTLIALLTELDGFSKDSQIITIAATNRPDVLDPAVLRPGRIERRIEVPAPDRRGREAILAVHTADKPLAGDVDLADVARRTPGLSGADLFRVCNEAALAGVRLKKKSVDAECFDAAIELVALGRERTSALITSRDREITAWHEAGHAVVALMLSEMEDPVAVSIVPRGPAGGVTWMGTSDDMYVSKNQALAQIACMLGGRLAEEILLGPGGCTQGASNDLEKATAIAESLVSRLGMTSRGLAVGRRDDDATRRAVDDVLTDAYERTRLLLTDNSSLLSATAAALLAEDRLNAKELVELRSRHAASPVSLGSFRPVPPVPTVASAPPLAPVQPAPIRPNRVRLRTRRSVADSVRSLLPSRRRFKA